MENRTAVVEDEVDARRCAGEDGVKTDETSFFDSEMTYACLRDGGCDLRVSRAGLVLDGWRSPHFQPACISLH